MVADGLEAPPRVLGIDVGGMVEVERSAVVDEPQPAVPPEQVRVLRRAVDVRRERVEPDDVRGEVRLGPGPGRRAERQRAGKEVDAEIEPVAREKQVLDLRVGLGAADRRVELEQDELRHRESERARELPDDHLGDERLRPLARAVELEHVQPVVVRLDEGGERPTLPQGRHVPRRRDPAHAGEPIAGRHQITPASDGASPDGLPRLPDSLKGDTHMHHMRRRARLLGSVALLLSVACLAGASTARADVPGPITTRVMTDPERRGERHDRDVPQAGGRARHRRAERELRVRPRPARSRCSCTSMCMTRSRRARRTTPTR